MCAVGTVTPPSPSHPPPPSVLLATCAWHIEFGIRHGSLLIVIINAYQKDETYQKECSNWLSYPNFSCAPEHAHMAN
ncbi:GH12773 [Drosophila grimshawi]|uniref:GH12773 n=1 Tax=Drosophila grimshawi TaxID=7222 RepID=B4JL22_DROGR|nr:GH12773 [Drosophila grimshawi]